MKVYFSLNAIRTISRCIHTDRVQNTTFEYYTRSLSRAIFFCYSISFGTYCCWSALPLMLLLWPQSPLLSLSSRHTKSERNNTPTGMNEKNSHELHRNSTTIGTTNADNRKSPLARYKFILANGSITISLYGVYIQTNTLSLASSHLILLVSSLSLFCQAMLSFVNVLAIQKHIFGSNANALYQ